MLFSSYSHWWAKWLNWLARPSRKREIPGSIPRNCNVFIFFFSPLFDLCILKVSLQTFFFKVKSKSIKVKAIKQLTRLVSLVHCLIKTGHKLCFRVTPRDKNLPLAKNLLLAKISHLWKFSHFQRNFPKLRNCANLRFVNEYDSDFISESEWVS